MKLNEIITKSFEEFDVKFDAEYPSVRSYTAGHLQDWVKSFFHQLLLSIAKGECERLEGEIELERSAPPADDMEKTAEWYKIQALSHSLEHWK